MTLASFLLTLLYLGMIAVGIVVVVLWAVTR